MSRFTGELVAEDSLGNLVRRWDALGDFAVRPGPLGPEWKGVARVPLAAEPYLFDPRVGPHSFFLDKVVDEVDGLDVLYNNSGIYPDGVAPQRSRSSNFGYLEAEAMLELFQVNTISPVIVSVFSFATIESSPCAKPETATLMR